MATTLNVTTTVVGDNYVITGGLVAGGTLPTGIFIYENNGDGTLGSFYGTCSMSELGRLTLAVPNVVIPLFGNKYVRSPILNMLVPLDNDPVAAVTTLVANVTALSKAYEAKTTTSTSYTIP